MKVDLTENVAELLDGTNFATIATLDPDGGPHTVVVSVIRDGNTVLVSTTVDSNKTHNLERDPRISVSVFDSSDPGRSVNIRGLAEVSGDPDKSLLRAVHLKYRGDDSPVDQDARQWVQIRVTPNKITTFGF